MSGVIPWEQPDLNYCTECGAECEREFCSRECFNLNNEG